MRATVEIDGPAVMARVHKVIDDGRRFYEELLPSMKARGKTLAVVSHDERYFHVADRVLVMEDGRFVEGGRS